jgi:acetylornithine deacetylase
MNVASTSESMTHSAIVAEVTELLRTLVRFETVSRSDNGDLQRWLADRLAERGGTAELVPGDAGRWNLFARFGPEGPGGVMFAGHTDVVPPGSGWENDPWVLTVETVRLGGRGTADMKGFFAACLVAFNDLDVNDLTAPVYLLASYDEEIGCVGIRDVLPVVGSLNTFAPDLVVVGEPTSMRPRHSHLGKQVFDVRVRAASGHSSRAASMPSAIAEAAALIRVLSDIQSQCPAPSDGSIPYSINVGSITGGEQVNVIADCCEFAFEVRFDADHDHREILSPFHDAVGRIHDQLKVIGGGVEVTPTTAYPALRTDQAHAAFNAAVMAADRGPAIDIGFGTEGGLIAEAFGVPVMICGPGDIAVAHRPGEHVPIADLERCVHFVGALIERFCRQ